MLYHPLVRLSGGEFPARVAGCNNLHYRRTLTGKCILEGLADSTFGLIYGSRGMNSLTGYEACTVELSQKRGYGQG